MVTALPNWKLLPHGAQGGDQKGGGGGGGGFQSGDGLDEAGGERSLGVPLPVEGGFKLVDIYRWLLNSPPNLEDHPRPP